MYIIYSGVLNSMNKLWLYINLIASKGFFNNNIQTDQT